MRRTYEQNPCAESFFLVNPSVIMILMVTISALGTTALKSNDLPKAASNPLVPITNRSYRAI